MADQVFAVNSGFYDAVNSDRTYSADDMNRPYKRVVSNGVFATPNGTKSTDLQVVSANNGMQIIVQKGEGIFADKWFENPAAINITVPANTSTVPRIDSVIVQVDKRTSGRVGNIVYRTGTPSVNPVAPSINTVANVIEYRLANVRVETGTTAITTAMITDRRGSSDCPWVTSLIYQVDTSVLYDQWAAAYEEYFEAEKEMWDDWYSHLTEELNVSLTLVKRMNTFVTVSETDTIDIGIPEYNANTDMLEVYINGLRAIEGGQYTIDGNTSIKLSAPLSVGQTVDFIVLKSVVMGNTDDIITLINALEDRIATIQGGSPTVVSSASDMTDTDKIYILSTDSKWYYYNLSSSAWVAGGVYGGVPTDITLTQSGMAADAEVVGDRMVLLKTDIENLDDELYSDIPTVFASGGITSSGVAQSGNARIRTDAASMQKIKKGDFIEVDERFKAKVYAYSERTILSSYFIGSATDSSSGIVKIPDEYVGRYALILVSDANDNTADISSYVSIANTYVKYYSLRIKNKNQIYESDLSGNWRNLIAEALLDTDVITNGITYTINNFEITVNGTATSASNFNIINMPNGLPDWCERGKKYRVSYSVEQNCTLGIFFYSDGVLQDATLVTKTDSEFTVPNTADGILVRIHVNSGVVIDNQKTYLEICDTYTNHELSDMVLAYNRMLPLKSEIPKNAIEYHHLWDELVESGMCQRSEPTYMSYDTDHKYPLYTYTISINNVYLTPGSVTNYDKVNTDGTRPPYPKKKILLVSGIHGSEHMSPVILVEIIKKIWSEYKLSDFFGKYDVTIIPLVNPWGYSHSFVKNGNVVYYGSAWYPTQEYEIVENTEENGFYAGIRQNADGRDINRDFSDVQYTSDNILWGFVTEEAQYVRDVYLSNHYYASMDMHQHYHNDITVCGFAAISRQITAGEKRDELREKIAKACMNTDDAARISTGKTNYEQTSYIWTTTTHHTLNNYCAGYSIDGLGNTLHTDNAVEIPVVAECGARCEYYFGDVKSFNPIANAYGKTFFFELIKHLLID